MRLRTRAIRCDRPTVQGSPARSPAQCPRAGCQLVLPHRTIRCDAKDHARPRKYLEQNTFSKRGVQVELEFVDDVLRTWGEEAAQEVAERYAIDLQALTREGSDPQLQH